VGVGFEWEEGQNIVESVQRLLTTDVTCVSTEPFRRDVFRSSFRISAVGVVVTPGLIGSAISPVVRVHHAQSKRTFRNFSSAGACALFRVSFSRVSKLLSLRMSFKSCCTTVSSTTLWPGA